MSVHTDWSLQFINYPLLLLAKSCKLVPVMLVGLAVQATVISSKKKLLLLLLLPLLFWGYVTYSPPC